tara:strand:- start:1207 stop:1620 length:414 start_codon:yes stop_codon:yes gene_type:complete
MSTRNNTLVVDRVFAEEFELGFAVNPAKVSDNSFVNMYLHHDGYLEGIGVDLAEWLWSKEKDGFTGSDGSRLAAHLVHDFHYSSQYLYPANSDLDTEFTYIIWSGKKDVWLSCYDNYEDKCVFVGRPENMIKKYKQI